MNDAADILLRGNVVALPTDTVYGLVVDPTKPGALSKLFEIKSRPHGVQLPVLVSGIEQLKSLVAADCLSAAVLNLLDRLWPGALTVVLPRADSLEWDLGGDRSTIGVRCPGRADLRELCNRVGPLASTSSNQHGKHPMFDVSEIAQVFGRQVELIVDGGTLDGPASTVIDLVSSQPRCIREGAIPCAEITTALQESGFVLGLPILELPILGLPIP